MVTPPRCPFCAPDRLDTILATSPNFLVIADHAPLTPGHTLVIPRAHYACYGAVPAELDGELAAIRTTVGDFLTRHYPPIVWFEHGVFHQTVYHAHLHAMPVGTIAPTVSGDPALGGRPVHGREDVRAWFAEYGHYTYLEEPSDAAVFPADEAIYRGMLRALFTRRQEAHVPLSSAVERYLTGTPKIAALRAAWRADDMPLELA